jgi:hypothetical protein
VFGTGKYESNSLINVPSSAKPKQQSLGTTTPTLLLPEQILGTPSSAGSGIRRMLSGRLDAAVRLGVLGIGYCLVVVVMTIEVAMSPARVMARRALAVLGSVNAKVRVAAMMPSTDVTEVAVNRRAAPASILTRKFSFKLKRVR